jgi:hypothetical protein
MKPYVAWGLGELENHLRQTDVLFICAACFEIVARFLVDRIFVPRLRVVVVRLGIGVKPRHKT